MWISYQYSALAADQTAPDVALSLRVHGYFRDLWPTFATGSQFT
jgi:hypothetical protein